MGLKYVPDLLNNPAVYQRLDLNHFISTTFDAPVAMKSPSKLIVICTVPRTAGNTLCRHMTMNGWGIPSEYFLPDMAIPLFNRWSGRHVRTMNDILLHKVEYGSHLMAKRSSNGVFSLKLFPHQWEHFIEALSGRASAMDRHCVLLQRTNLVEQTISILATMQTRRPSFSELELSSLTKITEVDHSLVRRTFHWLLEKENQWPSLIAHFGGSLHRVRSEDLIENPAKTLSALADYLGLPLNPSATRQSIDLEQNGAYQTNRYIKDEIRSRFSSLLEELKSAAQRS